MTETKKSFVPTRKTIELYSPQYFLTCTLGGILACGPTHAGVTPLDLVKCRSQVKPDLYRGILDGWRTILKTEGFGGIWVGLGPTFVGYSMQGAGKYGLYEFFKYYYGNLVGENNAYKHRTVLALAASGTAEFVADVLLCPMESIKVRMQTSYPPYAKSFGEGFNKLKTNEGLRGFYKGLVPLWSRQIPYTCMKFATFEKTVELIYSTFLSKPKSEYNKFQQLLVSFTAGYTSGILVALVSHPADVIVSRMNAVSDIPGQKKMTMVDIAKDLGLKGVWRGLGTRVLMIGTLTSFQWLIYDTFKVYMGLPTTGGAAKQIK
ncbi:phosphate carrier protein 2 [Halteromyces radiatus]|uniref:phosphate carrier protein 2 n=1 Tax=Halteromyces radiatus TaxID=101107 RepID=UPI002220AA4C|nr:phosphate carrier protein 2 [Halteromyces radiatus]KAI8099589.1 phosphate carrier protein 2 [Halteromyces radiatus]